MEIATVNCSSCGAPIRIPPGVEYFNCAHCGASLVVQRGDGHIALKLAEEMSKSIQDVGKQTQSTIHDVGKQTQSTIQDVGEQTQSTIQDVGEQTQSTIREGTQITQNELKRLQLSQEISSLQVSKSIQDAGEQTQSTIREGAQITQNELKRLQLSQEISSLRIQLSSVQSEIRSFQRQKADRRIRQQLKELSGEEAFLINRIKGLQMALAQSDPAQAPVQSKAVEGPGEYPAEPRSITSPGSNFCSSPIGKGCLTSFLVFIAGSIVCGIPAQALDQAIFNIPMDSSSSGNQPSGPIFSLVVFFIFVAVFVGFVYGVNPKAKIWISTGNCIRKRIGIARTQTTSQTASVQDEPDGVVSEAIEKPDQP